MVLQLLMNTISAIIAILITNKIITGAPKNANTRSHKTFAIFVKSSKIQLYLTQKVIATPGIERARKWIVFLTLLSFPLCCSLRNQLTNIPCKRKKLLSKTTTGIASDHQEILTMYQMRDLEVYIKIKVVIYEYCFLIV